MAQEPRKHLKFIKIKCHQCGKLNLIPVYRTLHLFESVRCEFCGAIIMKREKRGVCGGRLHMFLRKVLSMYS